MQLCFGFIVKKVKKIFIIREKKCNWAIKKVRKKLSLILLWLYFLPDMSVIENRVSFIISQDRWLMRLWKICDVLSSFSWKLEETRRKSTCFSARLKYLDNWFLLGRFLQSLKECLLIFTDRFIGHSPSKWERVILCILMRIVWSCNPDIKRIRITIRRDDLMKEFSRFFIKIMRYDLSAELNTRLRSYCSLLRGSMVSNAWIVWENNKDGIVNLRVRMKCQGDSFTWVQ